MTFSNKIYELLKTVPSGRVTTYKALANALITSAYRAVGTAMKNNPNAPSIPCHRCVSSNGTIGGFMGQTKGPEILKKKKMLESEGIMFDGNKIRNFNNILFSFY